MKIAIVGTGAMGAVYAGLLADAGNEVWAIDRWADHVDAIAARGLRVWGASGDRVVTSLHTGTRPADAGACDLWVIATKAQDVDDVMADVVPLLRDGDVVMPFQNGLGAGERVARHTDADRIVVGIAEGFGSSIPEPGSVHHNGMRLIRIGDFVGASGGRSGAISERALAIEACWRDAGFNVRAFGDIGQMIWEKFVCNVTFSAPTAVFDMTIGEVRANPETWGVALGCMHEAYDLGVRQGVTFSFADPAAYVATFAASIPDASPSMRLDHVARRRGEVDVINGAVVDLGRDLGVPTPYNESLCAVLRAREARFD